MALKEVRVFGGNQSRNPNFGFRYQGGSGVVSRMGLVTGFNNSHNPNRFGRAASSGSIASSNSVVSKPGENGIRNSATRNLPYQEFVKQREEGRCYHCNLPYVPGHRCTEKSLRLVILAEDEQYNENGEMTVIEQEERGEEDVENGQESEC